MTLPKNSRVALAIFVAIIVVGVSIKMTKYVSRQPPILRVSMNWKKSITEVDPAKISYINEAVILDNIYGNLVTYDEAGHLTTDLADDFYWNGHEYIFSFSGDKKTSKGQPITAQDAADSLMRLILLSQNTHGQIKNYLCQSSTLSKLGDSCDGIVVENELLKLKPSKNISHDLLISLLAGVDFKIIPSSAFEHSNQLKITDYSNTTGPYYFDPNSTDKITFLSNPFHYAKNDRMPAKWEIVPKGIVEKISNVGIDIDLIITSSFVDWDDSNLDAVNEKYEIFSTLPISTELLIFSEAAQKNMSTSERSFVAQKIKDAIAGKFDLTKRPTFQFFPEDSSGFLSKDQEKLVIEKLLVKSKPSRVIKVAFPKSLLKDLGDTNHLLEDNIKIVELAIHEYADRQSEVDAIFVSTDSAFQEDISMIEYNLSFGIFGLNKLEGTDWLNSYLTGTKTERIKKLQNLHFKILTEVRITPLYAMPYYAVSNKSWKINMSKLNATTQIWKMEYQGI